MEQMDVAEVYSPPRRAEMASRMGLRPGWSLDFTTCDEQGRPWDFNCPAMRNVAVRKFLQDKPRLLVGSPMCSAFSTMNDINYSRMIEEEKHQRLAYGRKHLEFCTKLYEIQWREGRYFLNEHPNSASAWQEECINRMLKRQGVVRVAGDQCRYGLRSNDGEKDGPAQKRAGFMTNSPCIAKQLSLKCPNNGRNMPHDHIKFINGRASAAQIYPPGLCRAVCKGLIEQIEMDRTGQFLLVGVGMSQDSNTNDMKKEADRFKEKCRTVEEDHEVEMEEAWDDVSGEKLDPAEVKKARKEEVDYVRKMKLYNKVPIAECYAKTGKASITVRWIGINKGDSTNPNYRSRLVAREINTHKRDDLFAGTPPLEALKSILSMAASGNRGEVVMVNGVSRAFFHAKARREVYVQIAAEDMQPGDEGKCGKLSYSMYGTRDAAQNWASEYVEMLVSTGFEQGKASPCVFFHRDRSIRTFVHGDDYVSTAKLAQLKWLKSKLEEKYQIKTQWLGPGQEYQQEINILNRIVGWDIAKGILFEADPRHVEIIIEQFGLKEAKIVSTPGTKDEGTTTEDCNKELDEKQATQYRAIAARCNYISPGRPDLAYSVKEIARPMSKPIVGDWQKLKRLGRYLLGRPRMQHEYNWQETRKTLQVFTDVDWAGCRETRKSTIGGCGMLGNHALKGWSKT